MAQQPNMNMGNLNTNMQMYGKANMEDPTTPMSAGDYEENQDGPMPGDGQLIRMACELCRRRKLKCDRQVPSCDSCIRLGFKCVYGKLKARKGTRRSHVLGLEQRLAHIESLLRSGESAEAQNMLSKFGLSSKNPDIKVEPAKDVNLSEDDIAALERIYFEQLHPLIPIIHRRRYDEASRSPTKSPPLYLRYAIWAASAFFSDSHSHLHDALYLSARKQLEEAEIRDQLFDHVTIAQTQAWVLVANYEFMRMFLHRSWMSTGRAVRLAQMMRLHSLDLDQEGGNVQSLAVPRDWTEREEWRRTFWMVFCLDTFVSVGFGWPATIDLMDVQTALPVADWAYQASKEANSMFLKDALTPEGSRQLSPYSGLIVMTALAARRLTAIRRYDPDESMAEGQFIRSRWLESVMVDSFEVPEQFRMSVGNSDPNIIFLNMVVNSATIVAQKAASHKADPQSVGQAAWQQSERIQLECALNITRIVKAATSPTLCVLHPFTPFCVYVAATVFARSAAAKPNRVIQEALQYLLAIMTYLTSMFRITQAFITDLKDEFPELSDGFQSVDTNPLAAILNFGMRRPASRRASSVAGTHSSAQGAVRPMTDTINEVPEDIAINTPSTDQNMYHLDMSNLGGPDMGFDPSYLSPGTAMSQSMFSIPVDDLFTAQMSHDAMGYPETLSRTTSRENPNPMLGGNDVRRY